jgi:uncharacterized protein (DUF58 family)
VSNEVHAEGASPVPAGTAEPGRELFDPAFLAKLEQLHLLSRRLFRGRQRAERRSRQLGSSLEFADYRNYTSGDDLRRIDWNIYGRLERLFIKLFEEEQDLHIYFLVDTSRSMRWRPNGGRSKLDQARRLTAALAYIGLANLDRINVFYFDAGLVEDLGLRRGRSRFHEVLSFLERVPAGARTTALATSMRAFVRRVNRAGLVFLISDLLDPAGYEDALSLLRHHGFEAFVLQLFHPQETAPAFSGDVRLADTENGVVLETTVDESVRAAYLRTVAAFFAEVERHSLSHGLGYARAGSDVAFEDLVLRVLRQRRIVR